jgi:hypothetical protein
VVEREKGVRLARLETRVPKEAEERASFWVNPWGWRKRFENARKTY